MKKLLSLLVVLSLITSLVPYAVFADDEKLLFDMDLSAYNSETKIITNAVADNTTTSISVTGTPVVGKINNTPYIQFSGDVNNKNAVDVIDTSFALKNELTFEFWMKDNKNDGQDEILMLNTSEDTFDNIYSAFYVQGINGKLYCKPGGPGIKKNNAAWELTPDVTQYENKWTHYVITRSFNSETGWSANLYINGALAASDTNALISRYVESTAFTRLTVGNNRGCTYICDAAISGLKVYNSILSADSVAAKYNASCDNYVDEKLLFDMDLSAYNSETKIITNAVADNTTTSISVTGTPVVGKINNTPYIQFSGDVNNKNAVDVIDTSFALKNELTFEFWMKDNKNDGQDEILMLNTSEDTFDNIYSAFYVQGINGKLYCKPGGPGIKKNNAAWELTPDVTQYENKWTHYVITRSFNSETGWSANLYINGALAASDTNALISRYVESTAFTRLTVGNNRGCTYICDAAISGLKVYNSILSADSVSQKYSSSAKDYCELTDLVYTDIDGNAITSWESVTGIKAAATITNWNDALAPAVLLVAYGDNHKKLIGVTKATVSVDAATKTAQIHAELGSVSLTSDSGVRLLIWKDMNSMQPIQAEDLTPGRGL